MRVPSDNKKNNYKQMKSYPLILILLVSFFTITSCTDNFSDLGKGLQSQSDLISVGADTFHLSSKTIVVDSIISKPDSFLLGSFYDPKFGTTTADILAQVNCPEGFKFPPNAKVDSAKIILFYNSCFGSTTESLDINIYEMDKSTFIYSGIYPSNLNPLNYSSLSNKLGERIISAGANSSATKSIEFRLDTNSVFVKGLRNETHYTSDNIFSKYFGGMYISTQFGASTLLNIGSINMIYYYHSNYKTKNIAGGDSIATVKDKIPFPANGWVRQVNRIQHPNRGSISLNNSQLNYMSSPANLHTGVKLSLDNVRNKLKKAVPGKTLTINSATLRVEVDETEQDTILHPIVKYVLLIKESEIQNFFNNKELPTETSSVLAQYTTSLRDGTSNVYDHYYSFNVSKLIANELKGTDSELNFRLIPVAVGSTTNSSGTTSINSVKQQFLMSAATLRSGSNSTSPMRLKVVYSGF